MNDECADKNRDEEIEKLPTPSKGVGNTILMAYLLLVVVAIILLVLLPEDSHPKLQHFLGFLIYAFGLPLAVVSIWHLLDRKRKDRKSK